MLPDCPALAILMLLLPLLLLDGCPPLVRLLLLLLGCPALSRLLLLLLLLSSPVPNSTSHRVTSATHVVSRGGEITVFA